MIAKLKYLLKVLGIIIDLPIQRSSFN